MSGAMDACRETIQLCVVTRKGGIVFCTQAGKGCAINGCDLAGHGVACIR